MAGDVAGGSGICLCQQRVWLSPDLLLRPCAAPCALILTWELCQSFKGVTISLLKCFEIFA